MTPERASKTRAVPQKCPAASALGGLLGLMVAASALTAQGSGGGLRISITGGGISGVGEIWNVDKLAAIVQEIVLPTRPPRLAQAACPVESGGLCRLIVSALPPPPACVRTQCVTPEAQWDTLRVRQLVEGGWTISLSVALNFAGPVSLGGTLDLNLLNLDKVCSIEVPTQIDDGSGIRNRNTNPNPPNCTTVDTQDGRFAVVDLMPFVQVTLFSVVYIQLSAGVSAVPNTTTMRTQFRTFVNAESTGTIRPTFQISFGFEPRTIGGDFKTVIGIKRHRFDAVTSVAPDGSPQLESAWHNQVFFLIGFSFTLDD